MSTWDIDLHGDEEHAAGKARRLRNQDQQPENNSSGNRLQGRERKSRSRLGQSLSGQLSVHSTPVCKESVSHNPSVGRGLCEGLVCRRE